MKTITLQEAYAKATKGPLYAGYGEGFCFHEGNRGNICRVGGPDVEPTEETVAEVWPTSSDSDRYDAALLAHSFNHLPKVESALSELLDVFCAYRGDRVPIRPTQELVDKIKLVLAAVNQVEVP